ncbi:MAG: DinB family protein [bacterium]
MPTPRPKTWDLRPARGRSREAMTFLAQMDDLRALLWADLRGATAAELEWQPRRGTNSIGMLLAHLAVVETYWIEVALGRFSPASLRTVGGDFEVMKERFLRPVLGIHPDDDGLPLPPNGRPPAALAGWTLARHRRLSDRARAHVTAAVRALGDADLDRFVVRQRMDGSRTRIRVRWILYHIVEHYAGHYGQVLLLRHLYRDRRRRP